jgi:hypothetical protein
MTQKRHRGPDKQYDYLMKDLIVTGLGLGIFKPKLNPTSKDAITEMQKILTNQAKENPNARNKPWESNPVNTRWNGKGLLEYAVDYDREDLFKLILSYIYIDPKTILQYTADLKKAKYLKLLLANKDEKFLIPDSGLQPGPKIDVNFFHERDTYKSNDFSGVTALCCAAKTDDSTCLQLLLKDPNIDLNLARGYYTPLYAAMYQAEKHKKAMHKAMYQAEMHKEEMHKAETDAKKAEAMEQAEMHKEAMEQAEMHKEAMEQAEKEAMEQAEMHKRVEENVNILINDDRLYKQTPLNGWRTSLLVAAQIKDRPPHALDPDYYRDTFIVCQRIISRLLYNSKHTKAQLELNIIDMDGNSILSGACNISDLKLFKFFLYSNGWGTKVNDEFPEEINFVRRIEFDPNIAENWEKSNGFPFLNFLNMNDVLQNKLFVSDFIMLHGLIKLHDGTVPITARKFIIENIMEYYVRDNREMFLNILASPKIKQFVESDNLDVKQKFMVELLKKIRDFYKIE